MWDLQNFSCYKLPHLYITYTFIQTGKVLLLFQIFCKCQNLQRFELSSTSFRYSSHSAVLHTCSFENLLLLGKYPMYIFFGLKDHQTGTFRSCFYARDAPFKKGHFCLKSSDLSKVYFTCILEYLFWYQKVFHYFFLFSHFPRNW